MCCTVAHFLSQKRRLFQTNLRQRVENEEKIQLFDEKIKILLEIEFWKSQNSGQKARNFTPCRKLVGTKDSGV